ncbi:hypothetical protein HO999_08040 [Streptococcus suis]|nr:hypothetical protein [Streptococcus suis]
MICLYAADESLFEHNGLGILDNDLKKCHVEEELNNLYTLTAQYPLWAKFGKSIRNGMIIRAPTPNGDQLFRIYQSKPSMGMLEIHAFHIFYDLAFNFVEDTNIVSKSGQAWLQQLSQNTQYRHPFTFFSDISTVAGSRVVRKNCVEILLNTSLDNSFVNRFGGEILRDNFKVYFNRSIGENRGFKIRHKKNLKGYTANIDDKSVITRIMPIGFDGLLLPEKYVDSPRISDYPFPRIGKVEVDVKAAVGENADAKDAIPLNEAHAKMRSLVREQFGLIDVPTCSYEVDFVELSKTKEYADFQNLETVRIGDTVTVSHDEDGFHVEAKVIRYEYDSLAGSLLRIEAGQFESRSSNNSINQQRSIEQQLEDVKIETSNMVQVAANGKNTIYRGIDRPANPNVGDLWYEPLENSVVSKQWSGVDWELLPISDQNLRNVNVNNLSGNYIDVRRFRISSGDRDILYVNEAGEVILNAKRVQIDFTDVATKTDLQEIELTPGPKGADGRTPYIHWAYSDSADGTGLTTSDNGQRYIGHYSDYTQADSTDKTKYRWADRWARLKLEDNLLLNSSFNANLDQWQGSGVTIVDGKARITGEFNKTKLVYQSIKSQIANDDVSQVYIASISVKVTNYVAGRNPFFALYIDGIKNDSRNTQFGGTYSTANRLDAVNNRGVVQFATTFRINVPRNQIKLLDFRIYARDFTGEVEFEKVSLRRGDIDLGWQASPEDIHNQLNSKAGQAFTQEQLNALNERAGIMQAELEAKASLDTVNNILKQIKDMKAADEATWAKVEKDLITHLQRVIKIETNLGDQAQRWNAVDTFMQVSNDGLSLGKADGSSSMLFSPDGRITMFSSGTPVMYVDKGVIHIDNGIFSKTVQIGRFREEQYHNNPDINVKRYVY